MSSSVRIQDVGRRTQHFGGPVAAGVFAALCAILPASAQSYAQGPHTTVTLLAEHESIVPGEKLWLGLRFQMEKGWHIYWVNAGDSGEPPKIQWQLPAGFHVGPIEWPAPQKLTAPSIVDYGYENDALLLAPLSVPAGLKDGATETVAAKVNWLVCREICVPAKGQVSMTLPVGKATSTSSSAASIFATAEANIAKHAPSEWTVFAISEKNDFVLTLSTGKSEPAAVFFPLEPEQIDNDAPQVMAPFSRGVRLRLKKSNGLLKPVTRLRGVLEFDNGRAYEITAPVHANTVSH